MTTATPTAGHSADRPGTDLSPTERSTLRRHHDRAETDRAALYAVLDEALICHFGVSVDGSVRVLPTGYARIDDTLYLHASSGARSLREATSGPDICVTVTLVDGIVYSRSVMDHSMNYRSAMIHGQARPITDVDEKRRALRALTEHLAPGSWDHARPPTKRELAKTGVIALDLHESAVKIRAGDPTDDEADIADSTAWAGVLPLRTSWGAPEPSADLSPAVDAPAHVSART